MESEIRKWRDNIDIEHKLGFCHDEDDMKEESIEIGEGDEVLRRTVDFDCGNGYRPHLTGRGRLDDGYSTRSGGKGT